MIEMCQVQAVVLVHVQPGDDRYHAEQVTSHNHRGH